MSKSAYPSLARLVEVLKRQNVPGWGPDYIPGILATREEAPRQSRPSQFWAKRIRRYMHALSLPERAAFLLAHYHPKGFDFQEQRMLYAGPVIHPLGQHPSGTSRVWPMLAGLINIADALGLLKHLPLLRISKNGSVSTVPFPLFGDLLLYLQGKNGPYCVNWTVKKTRQDFELPFGKKPLGRSRSAAIESEHARHQLEAVYYQQGGIPTFRVTSEEINSELVKNLEILAVWSKQEVVLGADQKQEILDVFKVGMQLERPAHLCAFDYVAKNRADIMQVKAVLFQAIWSREICVDLFSPVLFDWPLVPEIRNPLDVYAAWFQESAQ